MSCPSSPHVLRPQKITMSLGEKNGFSRLTEAQVKQIRVLLADDSLTQKTIGSQFNVSRSTVKDIKSGKRWGHIPNAASSANQRAA